MKKTVKDYLKVLVLLLDEAVVIFLAIVLLRFFKISIPLPVTIVIALLLGVLVFVIHKSVISSFHRKQVAGWEGMIGVGGRVMKPLKPLGTVSVQGEYWRAKSVDDDMEFDEEIEIVGVEGLTLKVKRKERMIACL